MTQVELAKKYFALLNYCVDDNKRERIEEIFSTEAAYRVIGKSLFKTVVKGRGIILKGL